jgi:hypothetical protein
VKIPVTRNFDVTDPIGVLILQDDVDISIDSVFALGYSILEAVNGKPTKIRVHEVSLIPDSLYQPYEEQANERR